MRKSAWLLVLVLVLFGCSRGRLDKKTATNDLNYVLPAQSADLSLHIGRIGLACVSTGPDGQKYTSAIDPNKDVATLVGVRAGYVAITTDGQDFWKVSLTSQGQAFVNSQHEELSAHDGGNGCDYYSLTLPLARAALVTITNITSDAQLAVVEYDWKWQPTELGVALRGNGDIYLKLADDERKQLRNSILYGLSSFTMPIPIPSDEPGNITRAKRTFRKINERWVPDLTSTM